MSRLTDRQLSDIAEQIARQVLSTHSAQAMYSHIYDCRSILHCLIDDDRDDIHELRVRAKRLLGLIQ